ncbi:hypothetical protein [Pseudomonas sp. Ps21-P2]|uniref:hypothetical protein n=1 Tax=Pseudomonas sp. Ps21-P2 TaxID=3080331 RepID=UPI00320B0D14
MHLAWRALSNQKTGVIIVARLEACQRCRASYFHTAGRRDLALAVAADALKCCGTIRPTHEPPWSGTWFRKHGFGTVPSEHTAEGLKQVMDEASLAAPALR